MRVLLCLFVLAGAGCLRKTEFRCSDDSACGAAGRCEATGFCSFVDGECASGRRYDDSAGALAGACTSGGTTGDDGGLADGSPMTDGAMPDTPSVGCPAGYAPLAGAPGHLYKVVPTTANWATQRDQCRLTSASAYLAIPDTIEELTALDGIANATTYWVGISDSANEDVWRTVLDTAQTFLPWQPPAPDNGGGQEEDCVEAISAIHKFNDRRCNNKLPAICECNP